MTTEDDFQRKLDEDPTDWQTRLVFADWLQEHNDERAAGYRALGERRKTPLYVNEDYRTWWYCVMARERPENVLEGMWWQYWKMQIGYDKPVFCLSTRREAEDPAALAFSMLSTKEKCHAG